MVRIKLLEVPHYELFSSRLLHPLKAEYRQWIYNLDSASLNQPCP